MSIEFSANLKAEGTCFLDMLESEWSFSELVARLYAAAQYEIFTAGAKINSDNKTSFEVRGLYKGAVFTLYDYKEDFEVHIGGLSHNPSIPVTNPILLDVEEFWHDLITLLETVEPKPFVATTTYDECVTYRFPEILSQELYVLSFHGGSMSNEEQRIPGINVFSSKELLFETLRKILMFCPKFLEDQEERYFKDCLALKPSVTERTWNIIHNLLQGLIDYGKENPRLIPISKTCVRMIWTPIKQKFGGLTVIVEDDSLPVEANIGSLDINGEKVGSLEEALDRISDIIPAHIYDIETIMIKEIISNGTYEVDKEEHHSTILMIRKIELDTCALIFEEMDYYLNSDRSPSKSRRRPPGLPGYYLTGGNRIMMIPGKSAPPPRLPFFHCPPCHFVFHTYPDYPFQPSSCPYCHRPLLSISREF